MSTFTNLLFDGEYIGAIAFIFAAVLSIVIHEVSHGLVAMWNGDMTAKYRGRLTMNPVKHFDPFGFLMLAVVGFGWAKPVPIDTRNFKKFKRGLFTVSIAGVVSNFIIAFFSIGLFFVTVYVMPESFFQYFLYWFFMCLYSINLMLVIFNLLPIYPLDGFRVVEALTPYNNVYVRFMRQYGVYVLLGVLIASQIVQYFFNYNIFTPIINGVSYPIRKFWELFF